MPYVPRPVPQLTGEAKDLALWISEELRNVARTFQESEQTQFTVLYEEPPRPREGMAVVADGTEWNPGQGAGQYTYISGAWVFNGNIAQDLSGYMLKSQNLNDVANKATARDNLGVEIGADVQAFDAQLFSNIPFRQITSPYTTIATDAQKFLLPSTNAAMAVTINTSAYTKATFGECISFLNWTGSNMTIAVSGGTLCGGALGTGTRTLVPQSGMSFATAVKINTIDWIISGTGLT